MADWSAQQYLLFEEERARPARDLINGFALENVRDAVDLGCGPGNSTALVLSRYPNATVTGVDLSPDMLEKARRRLPDVTFIESGIEAWEPRSPLDLIFSNAAFQWVPSHVDVLVGGMLHLRSGGALAVQMPDNLDEPSHRLMAETAASGPWAEALRDVEGGRETIRPAQDYYSALKRHASRVDVWRTVYNVPLAGHGALVEWFKGSALRPYLGRLNEVEQKAFLDAYQRRIAQTYPVLPTGDILLAFPRLFVVAKRA